MSIQLQEYVFNISIKYMIYLISAISWRPALAVEEAGVPGENHRPWASKLVNFITCGCESSALFFVIYKAGPENIHICCKLMAYGV